MRHLDNNTNRIVYVVSSDQYSGHCLQEEVKEKAAIEDAKKEEATPEEDPKGIPEFWLTIFKSVDMLSDMLQVCQSGSDASCHYCIVDISFLMS